MMLFKALHAISKLTIYFSICAMIDTGSQVSIITECAVKLLCDKGVSVNFVESKQNTLIAIDGSRNQLRGAVTFTCALFGVPMLSTIPYAIVKESSMPCCSLLKVT